MGSFQLMMSACSSCRGQDIRVDIYVSSHAQLSCCMTALQRLGTLRRAMTERAWSQHRPSLPVISTATSWTCWQATALAAQEADSAAMLQATFCPPHLTHQRQQPSLDLQETDFTAGASLSHLSAV